MKNLKGVGLKRAGFVSGERGCAEPRLETGRRVPGRTGDLSTNFFYSRATNRKDKDKSQTRKTKTTSVESRVESTISERDEIQTTDRKFRARKFLSNMTERAISADPSLTGNNFYKIKFA